MATQLYEGRSQDSIASYMPPIAKDGFEVTTGDGDTLEWTLPSDCNEVVFMCTGFFRVSLDSDGGAPPATPTATTYSEWNPSARTVHYGATLYFYTPKACILSATFYGNP